MTMRHGVFHFEMKAIRKKVRRLVKRNVRPKIMKEILRPLYYSLAKRLGSKERPKSYPELFRSGRTERPHYAYCVYQAAVLAKRLGYPRISVIEFGVAGGNGLVNLEWHAREISRWLSIGIDVYGFDTGK